MIIFLILAICAIFYATVAGLTFRKIEGVLRGRCSNCSGGYSCYLDHATGAFFAGATWPLGLPFSLALLWDDIPHRDDRKRAKEIEEAKHQAELAKIRRIEDEELERQLRQLGG